MSEKKIDRFVRTVPKVFKPNTNEVINALLQAWAQEHDTMVSQIQNTKMQLFVKTAEGQFLDRLGSGLGVSRPGPLGMQDADYQNFIPTFSTAAKNIRKTFYQAMDIFWGPLFSRANVTSQNFEPFNVSPGDTLSIIIDNGLVQSVAAVADDIATPGAATAEEIASILSRVSGSTASIINDPATGHNFVNLRTNTPGGRGAVAFQSSEMLSPSKLDFDTSKKYRVTDLNQRTVIWEINPREIIIELPAILPSLRRTLKGSHHLHADSSLQGPVPPNNGIWVGSFLYTRSGLPAYTVSSIRAVMQEQISKGSVVTKVTVDNASAFPDSPGLVIFGWGTSNQEVPVKYLSRPNDSTLLLDPAHTFSQTHSIGTYINALSAVQPPKPRSTGDDYAIYLNSPSSARALVQTLLQTLAAAGVVVTFVVLLPDYPYLTSNPYSGT